MWFDVTYIIIIDFILLLSMLRYESLSKIYFVKQNLFNKIYYIVYYNNDNIYIYIRK